jgi:carboxyl-terminal processing protease
MAKMVTVRPVTSLLWRRLLPLAAALLLLASACRDVHPSAGEAETTSDAPAALAAASTPEQDDSSPLAVIREAYLEISGQLFREVTPRELLAPAWRAIAAEARRQGARNADVAPYQSRGSDDIDAFAREFTSFIHGSGQTLDPALLGRAAVRGMAASVGDSHTRFLNPQQEGDQRRAADGDSSYIGIGVLLRDSAGTPTIAEVYMDSPADRAGLRAGDRIVRVNDQDIGSTGINDVSSRVRGPEGSEVKLTIHRAGEGLVDVTVSRARVSIPVVASRMLDRDVGYIKIASLPRKSSTTDAARDFDTQLARLVAQGARGIVLDLRGNPGGDPFTSVAVASNFVPDGPIFFSVNRDGRRTTYPATSRPTLFRGPVGVLVDRGTASGAEVIASALQEYGAGYLVGTNTCGCLSVGKPMQLGDSSGLIVTVEQAFTGRLERSLEGVGLEPDQLVRTGDAADAQREQAQAYVRSRLP